MARDYGRIRVTIWQDEDFLRLSVHAQNLYFYLITQSKIDMAGIVAWRPRMVLRSARGWTEDTVQEALTELEDEFYVLLDEDTDELLVRSFIRSDDILKSPNLTKALVKAWRGTDSTILRGVIGHEVSRMANEDPSLKGLEHADDILAEPLIDPRNNPFQKGSGKGSAKGCGTTATTSTPETSTSSSAAPAATAPETHPAFDEFWQAFPSERKANKRGCAQKFTKAVKNGTNPQDIVDAAHRYHDDPNREAAYTVNPHTWLHEERWLLGPLPPRAGNGSDRRLERGIQMIRNAEHTPRLPDEFPLEIRA